MAHPLRRFREKNEISQAELARRLGFSRMTVIRWEKGRRKPTPRQIEMICEKTGISPRELRPDLAKLLERS